MALRGWLIYQQKDAVENASFIDWFIKEADQQQIELKLVLREELTIGITNYEPFIQLHGKKTVYPHFAIVRTIEPSLQVHLEQCGIQTFNHSTISKLCNNKSFTHLEMSTLNIPMVDTIFIRREILTIDPPTTFPFVVKESAGRSGKQVYFIQTNKDWQQSLPKLSSNDLLIQKTNVQIGKDLRVFVVGNEIVGAVLRESQTDFRANFTLGGTATTYPLTTDERKLIQKIIDHFDFGMVGIDFLIGLDGELLFNEIEDVVGSRILSATSDVNITAKYIKYIRKQMRHVNE